MTISKFAPSQTVESVPYFDNVADIKKALKRNRFVGVVLYQGPSLIDGSPVVAIANRIETASKNEKTGAMVQTWIIRDDMHPVEAVKTGDDSAVCGDCKHRPSTGGACYVKTFHAPTKVYTAHNKGRYMIPGLHFPVELLSSIFEGTVFRVGSYGDPAAIPTNIWATCLSQVKHHTGYTHQWRNADPALADICMASVDNAEEYRQAKAMGWRTFRVMSGLNSSAQEVLCPASKEAGVKSNCAKCRLCSGNSSKAKKDVAIVVHGGTAKRFKE